MSVGTLLTFLHNLPTNQLMVRLVNLWTGQFEDR